jgi:hypothetical protein
MSHREFNHLLNSLGSLSPKQLATLRRELDSKLAPRRPGKAKQAGKPAEETVLDVSDRARLIGCLTARPNTPSDLSTNPKQMEGFGDGCACGCRHRPELPAAGD